MILCRKMQLQSPAGSVSLTSPDRLHVTKDSGLIRIFHLITTAAADNSSLTALCSVDLPDVLYKYDCGGFSSVSGLNKPCQAGLSGLSLQRSPEFPLPRYVSL